jgi:hypothetical protein
MLFCGRGAGVVTVGALLVTASLGAAVEAHPPQAAKVYPSTAGFVNPNYMVAPGLTLNQYAYNLSVLGRVYSQIPPYALGYNPYPPSINYTAGYSGLVPAYSYYMPYSRYGYGLYSPVPYAAYGGLYNYP